MAFTPSGKNNFLSLRRPREVPSSLNSHSLTYLLTRILLPVFIVYCNNCNTLKLTKNHSLTHSLTCLARSPVQAVQQASSSPQWQWCSPREHARHWRVNTSRSTWAHTSWPLVSHSITHSLTTLTTATLTTATLTHALTTAALTDSLTAATLTTATLTHLLTTETLTHSLTHSLQH